MNSKAVLQETEIELDDTKWSHLWGKFGSKNLYIEHLNSGEQVWVNYQVFAETSDHAYLVLYNVDYFGYYVVTLDMINDGTWRLYEK